MKPRGTSDSSSQTAHERHYKINIGGSQTTVVEGDPVVLSNSLGFNGWDLDRYHHAKRLENCCRTLLMRVGMSFPRGQHVIITCDQAGKSTKLTQIGLILLP